MWQRGMRPRSPIQCCAARVESKFCNITEFVVFPFGIPEPDSGAGARPALQNHILNLSLERYLQVRPSAPNCPFPHSLCFSLDAAWRLTVGSERPISRERLLVSWRRVRGTQCGSCRAGSVAPSRSARSGSCSCWWRRRSAG